MVTMVKKAWQGRTWGRLSVFLSEHLLPIYFKITVKNELSLSLNVTTIKFLMSFASTLPQRKTRQSFLYFLFDFTVFVVTFKNNYLMGVIEVAII